MPNESLGRDLPIRHRSPYIRSLLRGVICVTKCQHPSSCFFLFLFLLLGIFQSVAVNDYSTVMVKNGNKISTKLYMYTHA